MFYVYLVPSIIMIKYFMVCAAIVVASAAVAAALHKGVTYIWSRLF